MASSKPTVDQNNTTEASDCPQCGSVCVGAFLLQCGHLVCRKCLRDHHGFQLTCSICNQDQKLSRSKGPEDFTSLVQQLGVDPVMVQLVDQRLRGQGRQSCVMCENRYSTTMCQDCKEQYCDGCAKVHRRQGLAKDHVLQTLPQEELVFGEGAPSSQVSRRHPTTTKQSGTSPTPQPVTTQQSGKPHTQPALPSLSSPASSPSSQRTPLTNKQAVLCTIVVFVVFYTGLALHTCFSPTSFLPAVDPMKASPRRVFTTTPACDDDEQDPLIISIISIEDGRSLVMSDYFNGKVKVVDMHHPHNVSASLTLKESPLSLAVLPDNLVAVTTWNKVIYLLKVTDTVTVTSRITTDIEYNGIAGHSDGNLIVHCRRDDNNGVARIDILSRRGRVVRTIADSHSLTKLDSPFHLYSMDNHVYVSDDRRNAVFKVDLNTGQVLDTMTHTELRSPYQITADTSGHLYIASADSGAVLVRSPNGQWRKLVEASQHSEEGVYYPRGVCVTSSGRLVVAWFGENGSVVIAYDL